MGIVIGWWAPKRLPDAYVEVEYIESSWTQYINTWRTPGSEYCKVEANVTPYRPAWDSYCALFWMRTSWDDRFALKIDDSNLWRVDLWENPLTWTDMTVSPWSNVDIRMVWDNRDTELVIWWVTCTMFSWYYPTIVQSTRPMYIFAYNEDWTATSLISMKLYSFKIYSSSSTLARDFVPCYRVSDSVIWLYDLVNDVFYTNAWTWVFTKWNDVQTAIDVLDIRYWRWNDYTPLMWPSPTWFHVPTKDEWQGLKNIMRWLSIDTWNQWKIKLHIPFAGRRKYDGTRQNQGTYWTYWSSSPYLYSSTSHSYYLYLTSSGSDASSNHNGRAYWRSVRCFKDTYATPDSSWTVVEWTLWNAWIFRDQTNWLISVTDGSNGYTIMDKNLWATAVYNDWDTLSETNCWKFYQWWNNYGFPRTWSMTTSSTQVDASWYWPWNYYSDSTYIINSSSPYDWSSVRNDNLWWYRDYSKPPEVKKIMMRPNNVETQVWPPKKHWTIANAVEAWTCPITLSNYYDECLEFSADWLHFYTSNNATSSWPFQVDLATAWDVTSATWSADLHSTMYYGSSWNWNWTPHWNADGSACTNAYWGTIKNFSVVTNWDLTSQLSINWTWWYSSPLDNLTSRWRKFIDSWNKIISQYSYSLNSNWCAVYNLWTPYDLRTIDPDSEIYYTWITWWDADYFMSEDGLHLYFVSPDINKINHYTLSTAWNISTATLTEDLQQSGCSWIYFHEDKMYIKYRAWNVKQFTVTYSS